MKIDWLGKNGVQGTNLSDRIMSVLGCLKPVRPNYERFRVFETSRGFLFLVQTGYFPVFQSPGLHCLPFRQVFCETNT